MALTQPVPPLGRLISTHRELPRFVAFPGEKQAALIEFEVADVAARDSGDLSHRQRLPLRDSEDRVRELESRPGGEEIQGGTGNAGGRRQG